ncbi:YbgC/FadM family acyl-CoA thioesterase [Enterobacter cloacae]|uniref:YbgC/FadM family acyl-CoA thioesterase n=1 Tax=Enterobacter cloacae TaxID=550 RepID=UPI00345CC334
MWASLINLSSELQFRVPFADIDIGKVVYHARYFHYLDQGRTEWFRTYNISLAEMMTLHDTALIVCRTEADYRAPARFDDFLTLRTTLSQQRQARFLFTQDILHGSRLLVHAHVHLATVSVSSLKPVKPPRRVLSPE